MPRSTKNMLTFAVIALAVSAGVVWAANNVSSVKRVIGYGGIAMRHTEIELDSFNGSSANGYSGKFNLQLPAAITYKEITIHRENLNNDQLRRVTLSLNGDLLVDVSGVALRTIQQFKDEAIRDGKWVIPFADFSMSTQEDQNLTSLVTLPGENVILEVETDAPTQDQVDQRLVVSIRAEGINLSISVFNRTAHLSRCDEWWRRR